MPDNLDIDSILESRRKAIAETIRTISPDEVKALGDQLLPSSDHPWRETLFSFLAANPNATYYHAATDDRAHLIFCPEKEKGFWFLPGSGMGPLQAKGLAALKEIVAGLK